MDKGILGEMWRMRIPGLIAIVLAGVLALSLGGTQPRAAGSDESPAAARAQEDPDWSAAKAAIDKDDYEAAIPLLQKVVARVADNADAYNYLGYAHSRLDRYDEALAYYQKALAIDPKHRGANEYLGELYLKLGDVAGAEQRLKVLDRACWLGCEEYTELKKAIADFKATGRYTPHKDD